MAIRFEQTFNQDKKLAFFDAPLKITSVKCKTGAFWTLKHLQIKFFADSAFLILSEQWYIEKLRNLYIYHLLFD